MTLKITKNYLEIQGRKYFRGDAHLVELGTYGKKKDPVGAKAKLDPTSKIPPELLANHVRKGPLAIQVDKEDWVRTSGSDVEVNGPIKVFSGSTAQEFTNVVITGPTLRLLNFYIGETALMTMLNTDADAARIALADEGNDGRIVSEVWVWFEELLAEQFVSFTSVTASAVSSDLMVAPLGGLLTSAVRSDLSITAVGGPVGSRTIKLSAGTTFAYRLHKVKNWDLGKYQIKEMEADYKGMS